MNQDKIGNFIKKIRLEQNLTQKDLADRLGVTYQAVSKWENGKNVPDIAILKKISEEFDVNIDEILNGEKNEKRVDTTKQNPWIHIIPVLFIIIGVVIVTVLNNRTKNFEFKTMSSKCSDFKITGSAAYNQDKTSIYISNIEFCGSEDKETYKEITCTLYENNNNTKIKISTCDKKNNSNLESFLKDVNISVDNYKASCKKLTSNTLVLEIEAINKENKTIKYTIPIKLDDSCK